jgi:hypothetical protein
VRVCCSIAGAAATSLHWRAACVEAMKVQHRRCKLGAVLGSGGVGSDRAAKVGPPCCMRLSVKLQMLGRPATCGRRWSWKQRVVVM